MTSETIPYARGRDFYVPRFEVRLRGRPLGKEVVNDIQAATVKDDIGQIDSFELTINNWDAEARTLKYSDKDLFDPGQELELSFGYYGEDLRLMIRGDITSLRPTFPASGPPTLAVSGLNLLHRLRKAQGSFTYENMTDAEIAKQIAGRLSIPIEAVETNEKHDYLFQDNQFDIVFLMERARLIGYDLFVKEEDSNGNAGESKLHFAPSVRVRDVAYKLTYGRSMIEFQPNLTTANQVGKVTVRGWDAVEKKEIVATATRDDIRTRGVGEAGGQSRLEQAYGDREEVIANQPVPNKQEAERVAKETLERIAKDMVKATASTVGLPHLRAGTVVELDGDGKRFSGRYFVTATTHTIGESGYTTTFESRREEV